MFKLRDGRLVLGYKELGELINKHAEIINKLENRIYALEGLVGHKDNGDNIKALISSSL